MIATQRDVTPLLIVVQFAAWKIMLGVRTDTIQQRRKLKAVGSSKAAVLPTEHRQSDH